MRKSKRTVTAGMQFGRLTVQKRSTTGEKGTQFWECLCSCGTTSFVATGELNAGKSKSCGCLAKELASQRMSERLKEHGHCVSKKRSSEYNAWRHMKQRCLNPDFKQWKDYGGRGIQVYQEWVDSFEAFLEHIGPKPSDNLTLDRIDNEKGYEPNNVRWADRKTQSQNRRCFRPRGD